MPLPYATKGQRMTIKAIRSKDAVRRFLGSLGFVVGASVTVVSEIGGNLILSVKDTRVALDKQMAGRIAV